MRGSFVGRRMLLATCLLASLSRPDSMLQDIQDTSTHNDIQSLTHVLDETASRFSSSCNAFLSVRVWLRFQ